MFDSLFRKKAKEAKKTAVLEYICNPARSVYGRYSGDASVIKPIPIDGFEKSEIDLSQPWPLLDITSARVKSAKNQSVNLHSFDESLVAKIEVTQKRIELMLREYETKIDGNNLDGFLAFAQVLLERSGVLFQQKKFVFNNIFDRMDQAESFNDVAVRKKVVMHKRANTAGFKQHFSRLISLEFKIYSELKKILQLSKFEQHQTWYLQQPDSVYASLSDDKRMSALLVNLFVQPAEDADIDLLQRDDVLRYKNRIERIANSYAKIWKQQLDFIYQWYPIIDAVTYKEKKKSKV